jgi:curved DNA-binding protein CbpA
LNLAPHYDVLGLAPGSSLAAVKGAYLREIKVWHPDRFDPHSLLREQAEERTKALTAAYAALSAALKGSASAPKAVDKHRAPQPPKRPAAASTPETRNGGGEWLGGAWRRLKDKWRNRPAGARSNVGSRPKVASRPKTAPRPPGSRRTADQASRRRVRPPFEEVLHSARSRPETSPDSIVIRRRLAAQRSRYGRRGRKQGTDGIDPIASRGPVSPVTPVRSIRPIGEDG